MEGPRAPSEAEYPNLVSFLNTELRPTADWSIATEYPTALSPANRANIRIIKEQNQVVSHAVLKPLIVKSPLAILKVGAIGSVVTQEQYRGRGYSRQVIEDCVAEATKQSCDVVILWTNLYDFYRKMDFELAGSEESVILEQELNVPNQNLTFKVGNQVAAEAIFRLYNHHTVGSIRSIEDIRKFLSIPQTVTYTAWDSSGQLRAFAVEGKGADLTGYLHEWGGQVTDLLALFSFVRKTKKTPVTIILPSHSLNLVSALKREKVVHNEGFLGMIRLTQEESLFQKVKKAARSVGLADLVLDKKENYYRLGVENDFIEFTDPKEMIRAIFGPLPEIPELKPETLKQIERVLPLPLWIWGWDSV